MNVLIWKKMKEIKKGKIRVLVFIAASFATLLMYWYLTEIKLETLVWAYPVSICFLATFVLFNADDLAQAILYEALGLRMRRVWMCNWMIVSSIVILVADSMMVVLGFVVSWEFSWTLVLNNLSSLPVVAALVALSTVHYRRNTRFEVNLASVFALVNMSMLFLPFVLSVIDLPNATINIISILSIIGLISSIIFFVKSGNDDIVLNTENFAKIYDEKFLGDEE